ncbi:AAA family ATPase [Desulfonatronovibrio magnus]|uniref:AAA family ATPase n=1 Tax=Desulfonatronovibrio magnus TaxID=698827 RepID=UPI0005EB6CEA|nr:MoxR family ATPase [Desulfonatronovibrio magnus]
MDRKTDIVVENILSSINKCILDKKDQVQLALTSFLAGGHLLIEDIPGVGKTTLALSMAGVLGLDFARIQMTSDLLPGDVLGVSMFDPVKSAFRFHPGPIFHSIILADEINRASPRTQSALLEAMAERQVSVDGETYPLSEVFLVIATQNPLEEFGVNSLPQSQMDRFLLSITLGYPGQEAERKLLRGASMELDLEAAASFEEISRLRNERQNIFLSDEIIDMVMTLTRATRKNEEIRAGLSPRGMLALKSSAQATAMIEGRSYVLPDDLRFIAYNVLNHRLTFRTTQDRETLTRKIISDVWG